MAEIENKIIFEKYILTKDGTLYSISHAHIHKVCNGIRKTAGGFVWQWGEN